MWAGLGVAVSWLLRDLTAESDHFYSFLFLQFCFSKELPLSFGKLYCDVVELKL